MELTGNERQRSGGLNPTWCQENRTGTFRTLANVVGKYWQKRDNVKQTGEESMQSKRGARESKSIVRAAAKVQPRQTIYLFLNQLLHLIQNVKNIGKFFVINTTITFYVIDTTDVCL